MMQDGMKKFHALMFQLEQNPRLGKILGAPEGQFCDLEQDIYAARKTLRVRDALLDTTIALLYQYFVISDTELARRLDIAVNPTRQAMIFIAGQLRDQVTLLKDNTRGWIIRLRWSFEEGS